MAMDSYTPLLEKIRVPQPSLQKFAVISIFSKLRSAPKYLDSDSEPGRDAISQCLHSASSAVVDQSVRELCRLVVDSRIDVSRGLLELQSALEGCDPRFVDLFVKGLGFLVRLGFQKNSLKWRFSSTENHPFVKVLSCRSEVQSELVQQVLLLVAHNKQLGMVEICDFLRPFLHYSILRIPFSGSPSSMFARHLISSMASLCCSFTMEAVPVFKLLTEGLKYAPCTNSEGFRNFIYFVEHMVDAHIVVLRRLAGEGLLIAEAQLCSLELLETILSVCSCHRYTFWIEPIAEVSRRLLFVQKDLGFQYVPKLSSATLSLFIILTQSELEHEQLSALKLLHFLLKWKYENEFVVGWTSCTPSEELLLIFPIISLLSSPSKPVKKAATDFLIMLEKLLVEPFVSPKNKPTKKGELPLISTPGSVIFRLLQHQWCQDQFSSSSFFLRLASSGKNDVKEIHDLPRSWASQLRHYCLWIVDRRKSFLQLSPSQEIFVSEMPLLLSAIAGVLLMHQSLGSIAVDSLTAIAIMDPKMGTQFLLAVLFYNNIFSKKDDTGKNMLLKLLGMLPALASHSGMIPLVVQTILPMLQKDSKPTLYATAIRLLCQTWEMNDRAFGSLQGVLLPKAFTEFESERNICISIAASIKDVCRKNADRGVDLILSVAACIESRDPIIQALGFQSLAHLCEADVIDFYTAWDVISKHVLDYSRNSILARSICLLLRWGAMDAEAYPEASQKVLQILWGIGTSTFPDKEFQWEKARISALEALAQYEVSLIEQNIPDFKEMYREVLFSETNLHVLKAMEELQVKIITYEHITRRRLRKEKGVAGSKIEKLLDVFPQVIFSSGKGTNARELAGAALLCLSFTPKHMNTQRTSKGSSDVHAGYEKAFLEFAASLQLSRNVFVALISLQSWKAFMHRWLRADIFFFDAKAPSVSLDKTTKAANDILKRMIHISKDAIPRSSENIALAIGALCAVLPPSVHTVKSAASKFLLSWLFQHEHEHRQWSAAISLGLISSCLHVTDHKQKFQNINGLLEVLCNCKSTLVKGACGVGLGFACQDLLTRVEAADNSDLDEEPDKLSEVDLLGKIVSTLLLIICQFTQYSSNIMESLSAYFPPSTYGFDTNLNAELSPENYDDLDEDIWGVSGVVLGFASSIGAVYRAGLHDAVLKIKSLIMSWIPHVNSLVEYSGSYSEGSDTLLSVGSCLALPSIVAFLLRVELMDVNEVDQLIDGYRELISELLSVKRSGIFHQSLVMASCIGAGTLVSCVLNEGVHFIEFQSVKVLLDFFRKCYSNPYPPLVHLGGLLGVVNAMGADAGTFFQIHPRTALLHTSYEKKVSNHLLGPLLSSPVCEPHLTSLMQEIFLIAQSSDDHQLQQYAAWAVSFLRTHLLSKELLNLDIGSSMEIASLKSSQNFSDDSAVMKLSLWLMHLDLSGTGSTPHISTVITVLRCLSQAPRLPSLDWGAIIRRCMRYEAQVAELLEPDSAYGKGSLRKECITFSLAHANQFDPLLNFLDEVSDLSRFRTLELNLQSHLLIHLADLIKVFSGSRLEKLFDDVTMYLSSISSNNVYNTDQKSIVRNSYWKGLSQCLDEASIDSLEYVSHIEKSMEMLFSLLPPLQSDVIIEVGQVNYKEEWSEAVRCLAKARRSWILNFLEVSQEDMLQKGDQFIVGLKKIQAKARLTKIGCLASTELGRLKARLLNYKCHGIWDVLTEVVAALQNEEGSVKRQWLIDAVEISCVSGYPSTALQFLGLLSGCCSKYMPLLILDRQTVLSDLPVTLSSLLSESSWRIIADSVVSSLLASTERIYNWATHISRGEDTADIQPQPIDESEDEMAGFLLRVMHHTCVSLKDYLPLEKQLKLANMIVG
ncbi:Armadillo-type fold containing protein [Trema orientale]|uniref:Armadillo-type fold containing protein n=1 Tax=Trema orientale TaxID=63057 RepID=A0A2P5EFC4_TREOI|nr:Armadillo-type fold containing protein [Trema orientale]